MSQASRLALAMLLSLAGLAHAATLTPAQRACQDAIASSGRKLLENAAAILAGCHSDVARGALPPGTSCVIDPVITQARSAAASKALRPVVERCTDADVTALAPAGDCRGVTTVTELISCLRATHEADAEVMTAVVDAVGGSLPDAGQACKRQVSRQARRLARARHRLVQKCQRQPDRHEPP